MGTLLARQLRKYFPAAMEDSQEMKPFLEAVEQSYRNYDDMLTMMQRATTISSEELSLADQDLKEEAERQKLVELSLKRAVDSLNINLGVIDKLEYNDSLNLGAEKLARHVSKLAAQISEVTEEKNRLLIELESQNESLNHYVQMVSHDLKSPIGNINALMSWILDSEKNKFSEDSKYHCDMVSENLLRMDNLVNAMLKHATVGDHMEMRTNLNMHTLVLEIVDSLSVPSNISVKVDENLPIISIQKYWIEQVFDNIIANAIKATQHKKSGEIAVGFIDNEHFWKFLIKDNGKGIPQKHMTSIFDMFTKLENGTNAAGAGLSLVKKITSLYKGDIWLESEVDKGTTFYVTFKKII